MFKKIINYVVYILSILIIIAFIALVYGVYKKIVPKITNYNEINEIISLSLNQNQTIKNIQFMKNDKILITIVDNNEVQGIVFDIKSQKIIQRITK